MIPFEKLPPDVISDKIKRRYVSGGKGMLARFDMQKGAIIPTHQHPHEQITYLLSGKIKVTMDNKEIILQGGEALVIPPNTPHQFEVLEDTIDIDVFCPPREEWLAAKRL